MHTASDPDFLAPVRAAYDAIAPAYPEYVAGDLAAKPLERALLATFAEFVGAAGGGQVADVGCGTGRITAHLRGLGVDVFGIDLSPGMLALARRSVPDARFEVGSMTDLDVPDVTLAGVVAYYSTIHVPDDALPAVLAGFSRALVPGGELLLAFQAGEGVLHLDTAFGQTIALDFHRRRPDRMAELLHEAGLDVHTRVLREPEAAERTPQAYLLARRPV